MSLDHLKKVDPELFSMIDNERIRQEENLELIASENITSLSVMEAQGSILTNKYAEGYPKKRYYGGCENVDEVEQLAIDRACQLFGANFANVQPHSGSQANQAVFFAELQPGDKILGMNLSEGGHLTHGSPVNLSGKLFKIESYGLHPETETIDYDELRKKAISFQPKLIIAGASAYPRIIDFKKFREIADECGAILMVDMAHIAGLIAVGLHPSPVGIADYVTTTTHKILRGPRGGIILTNDENKAKKINSTIFPGLQGGPLEHIIAAKAVALKQALDPSYLDYQKRVLTNAQALAQSLLDHGFDLVSKGSDNHLMLVNLINKEVTGRQLERNLDLAGITVNRNTVPNDPKSPFVTSGIRVGTPAVTTRGMNEAEMKKIAEWINLVTEISRAEEEPTASLQKIKEEVKSFTKNFSIYFP